MSEQKNKQNKFNWFLAGSLALHGFLILTMTWVGRHPEYFAAPPVTPQTVVEIEIPTAPKQQAIKAKQIVEQDIKPINEETPDKEAYLSRHNQHVMKETQASHLGDFQNLKNNQAQPTTSPNLAEQLRSKPTAKPSKETAKEQKAFRVENAQFDPFGDVQRGISQKSFDAAASEKKVQAHQAQQAKASAANVSQTQDYLKEVQAGNETLLNTREFKYFTYYERIRRQLSQYWQPKVQEKLKNLFRQGRNLASNEDHVTKLLIVLDTRGDLVKVQKVSESGVQDLDDAAVEAFKSAAPFPNPPRGIIDADGTVKIRWDFILES